MHADGTHRLTDRQTELIFFACFEFSDIKNKDIQGNFFNLAITILSLFTYSVCDEKVTKQLR